MTSKLALAVVAGAVLVNTAAGDGVVDRRWQLSVGPQFGTFRGQAPLPLSVTLRWTGSELMEGRLRLKWYVEQTHLGTYLSPETALSDSSLTRTVLLPPVIMPFDEAACSVQAEFVTADDVYDLDIHDLVVPLDWRRSFVVGLCRTPLLRMAAADASAASPDTMRLIQSLRLEQFLREPLRARELSTLVTEVDPDNLPTNPLQLLGFDMLVIPGESFGKLTEQCLEGLTTWVEAGGSLCVLVDCPLPKTQVDFLNRLAGAGPADAPYLRSQSGQMLPVAGDATGIDRHHAAFGRLVVARGTVDYDSDEWQRTLLFLWKAQPERIREWEQRGSWHLEKQQDRHQYLRLLTLEPQRSDAQGVLETLLMPESIQGLPLLTVAGILMLFLLAIAPGDYFLLGWLRRRRWTWVLFPAMSLLFTWLMMWLAERHLGVENLGRTITIVDLSSDGRPVRTSRFELLYSARSREDVAEQLQSLMVPIDPDTAETTASRIGYEMRPQYEPPWTYEGSVPGRHVVRRDIRQWSPRLARTTALGESPLVPDSPLAEFDWSSLTWERLTQPDGAGELRRRLDLIDPKADFVVVGKAIDGGVIRSAAGGSPVFGLVKSISVPGRSRLFTLVSQVSPTAAGHWEDLAIVDGTDDQLLVIAMTESSEGHSIAYRRLLKKEE